MVSQISRETFESAYREEKDPGFRMLLLLLRSHATEELRRDKSWATLKGRWCDSLFD